MDPVNNPLIRHNKAISPGRGWHLGGIGPLVSHDKMPENVLVDHLCSFYITFNCAKIQVHIPEKTLSDTNCVCPRMWKSGQELLGRLNEYK